MLQTITKEGARARLTTNDPELFMPPFFRIIEEAAAKGCQSAWISTIGKKRMLQVMVELEKAGFVFPKYEKDAMEKLDNSTDEITLTVNW